MWQSKNTEDTNNWTVYIYGKIIMISVISQGLHHNDVAQKCCGDNITTSITSAKWPARGRATRPSDSCCLLHAQKTKDFGSLLTQRNLALKLCTLIRNRKTIFWVINSWTVYISQSEKACIMIVDHSALGKFCTHSTYS